MMRKTSLLALLCATLALAACDPAALPPSTIAPICKALIGPIKYTSTLKSPMSKRYAAALLAMDLKQRNQVGRNLGCPLYK
jgi:hypothetical protein